MVKLNVRHSARQTKRAHGRGAKRCFVDQFVLFATQRHREARNIGPARKFGQRLEAVTDRQTPPGGLPKIVGLLPTIHRRGSRFSRTRWQVAPNVAPTRNAPKGAKRNVL